jgi:hypothetical protein
MCYEGAESLVAVEFEPLDSTMTRASMACTFLVDSLLTAGNRTCRLVGAAGTTGRRIPVGVIHGSYVFGDGRVGEGVNSLTKQNHWGCGGSVVPLH